ncbi:hypothetical protein LWI28_028365 [Acer negundo]|uniref:Uncharacterized protein n=1 Tax=Acer negundo TaxID=4023 RepID=A0AAD5IHS7_ACENE|nr:hypothetical protein LWI28_028365 [Acer negundo]
MKSDGRWWVRERDLGSCPRLLIELDLTNGGSIASFERFMVEIRRVGDTGLISGLTAVGGGEGGNDWTCVGSIADAGVGLWVAD